MDEWRRQGAALSDLRLYLPLDQEKLKKDRSKSITMAIIIDGGPKIAITMRLKIVNLWRIRSYRRNILQILQP